MKPLILIAVLIALVGCSGEPAPVVGDAPITKGITKRPPPKRSSSAAAASQPRRLTPQEYKRMRENK